MFPANLREERRNDIMRWYAIIMERAFSSGTTFYKTYTDDGMAVGLVACVLEDIIPNSSTQKRFTTDIRLLP